MAGAVFGEVQVSFFVAGTYLVKSGMVAGVPNVVFSIENARGEREK